MTPDDRVGALLAWYHHTARPFPWRSTRDPWALLVVETMSQQTQIGRVLPKWEAWMERYPTPADCAGASPEEVLELWVGLGYNRRAIRLRAASAMVAADGWPTTVEGLRRLPGVGPYTAAAVACQAFGVQVPTIDTNHRRILSRWEGVALSGDTLDDTGRRLLPIGLAEDWNQALMDLGATVCLPRPHCEDCPVASWCTDPTVYEPPRPQGRFEGSTRQVRGEVLKALLDGPADVRALAATTGHDPRRVHEAVAAMGNEGLVQPDGERWAVVGGRES